MGIVFPAYSDLAGQPTNMKLQLVVVETGEKWRHAFLRSVVGNYIRIIQRKLSIMKLYQHTFLPGDPARRTNLLSKIRCYKVLNCFLKVRFLLQTPNCTEEIIVLGENIFF